MNTDFFLLHQRGRPDIKLLKRVFRKSILSAGVHYEFLIHMVAQEERKKSTPGRETDPNLEGSFNSEKGKMRTPLIFQTEGAIAHSKGLTEVQDCA